MFVDKIVAQMMNCAYLQKIHLQQLAFNFYEGISFQEGAL